MLPTKTDPIFSTFATALHHNDLPTAEKVARRIANTLFIEVNQKQGPLFTLPFFHKKIVSILNRTDTVTAAMIRSRLAPYYFQDTRNLIAPLAPSMNWLSAKEVETLPFYYHATTVSCLKEILQTRRINSSEWPFPGAFVSVGKPAFEYGPVVLALNKSIERASPITNMIQSFPQPTDQLNGAWKGGWVGFSDPIQVNDQTLSHVVVKYDADISIPNLKKRCKQWAKREINVLSEAEANRIRLKTLDLKLGIPKEWGKPSYRLIPSKIRPSRSDFLPSKL